MKNNKRIIALALFRWRPLPAKLLSDIFITLSQHSQKYGLITAVRALITSDRAALCAALPDVVARDAHLVILRRKKQEHAKVRYRRPRRLVN